MKHPLAIALILAALPAYAEGGHPMVYDNYPRWIEPTLGAGEDKALCGPVDLYGNIFGGSNPGWGVVYHLSSGECIFPTPLPKLYEDKEPEHGVQ